MEYRLWRRPSLLAYLVAAATRIARGFVMEDRDLKQLVEHLWFNIEGIYSGSQSWTEAKDQVKAFLTKELKDRIK
jgi:hypothetical protein